MTEAPRYIVREHADYPDWWYVFDTVRPSQPSYAFGRMIYEGRDRDRVQADADWLNEVDP